MESKLTPIAHWLLAFAALLLSTLVLHPSRADAAVSSCQPITSTGITFSSYDTIGQTAVLSTGSVSMTCTGTGNNTLNVILTGGSPSCNPRHMTMGGNILEYSVFRDAARTSNFCTTGQNVTFNFPAGGGTLTRSVIMYGQVNANQNPVYGTSYSATLTASLRNGSTVLRTTSVAISGSVAPVCSVSAVPLGFGAYNPAYADLATATISVNCSNTAPYQVGLGGGNSLNGTTRRMAGPSGNYLTYQLYRDSSRAVAWGDGSALGARVSGTGSGGSQGLTVYGRIPAGQYTVVGDYSDSVVVTVEY